MISVECGWDELCHVLLGDRFLLYYIQKKRENLQLFLETAAEDCVYLETVTPKTLTVLPEELSLPHALRDPYRAECLGWREGWYMQGKIANVQFNRVILSHA